MGITGTSGTGITSGTRGFGCAIRLRDGGALWPGIPVAGWFGRFDQMGWAVILE